MRHSYVKQRAIRFASRSYVKKRSCLLTAPLSDTDLSRLHIFEYFPQMYGRSHRT